MEKANCSTCGSSIPEHESDQCQGYTCEKRLCSDCFSGTGGYCPECKKSLTKNPFQPDRTVGQKVGRALDWATGLADGALRRELQAYDGEFDMIEEAHRSSEPVQEMIRSRWKYLPGWKKKLYKAKKKGEMFVAKNVLKAGVKGGRLIGRLGRPTRLRDDDYEDNGFDDETGYEDDANGFDEEDYENGAEDDLDTSDDQIEEEDAYDYDDKTDYEEEDEEDEDD